MNNKPQDFAAILRTAAKKHGWSTVRLAAESGVPQQTISRFLSGKASLRLESAAKLAHVLGLKFVDEKPLKNRR